MSDKHPVMVSIRYDSLLNYGRRFRHFIKRVISVHPASREGGMHLRYPFTGRPLCHGGSLSRSWRKAALDTEVACPGAGGRPLWTRRWPVQELEEGRSGHGGSLSKSWRMAALTLEESRPDPGGRPASTRNEEDPGPAIDSPALSVNRYRIFFTDVNRGS
jgi:hypothetical protein